MKKLTILCLIGLTYAHNSFGMLFKQTFRMQKYARTYAIKQPCNHLFFQEYTNYYDHIEGLNYLSSRNIKMIDALDQDIKLAKRQKKLLIKQYLIIQKHYSLKHPVKKDKLKELEELLQQSFKEQKPE